MIAALKDYYRDSLGPYLHDLKDYFGEIYKMIVG